LDPLASPLLCETHAGLPSAVVITAEFDQLRYDGRRYAEALCRADVPCVTMHFGDLPHGVPTW